MATRLYPQNVVIVYPLYVYTISAKIIQQRRTYKHIAKNLFKGKEG